MSNEFNHTENLDLFTRFTRLYVKACELGIDAQLASNKKPRVSRASVQPRR